MKYVFLVSVAAAVSTADVTKDPTEEYKKGDRYFYFPGDGDGITHLVDTLEPFNETLVNNYLRSTESNAYWLYTRYNPTSSQIIVYGDIKSVSNSDLDFNKETVFLVHGWRGNGTNDMNILLTEAFLEDDDVNIIVLDWSLLANKNYVTAKNGVAEAGRGLGLLINWLATLGLSYEKAHLVGFSLGGHLVGIAGRTTDSRVRRITSLDPAAPLWESDNSRISHTDAQYVEIIHTNTALLGSSTVCGDADFFPNGGSRMNGCVSNSCSHSRAIEYMASSVKHKHLLAHECTTYREAVNDSCIGDVYPMGTSDMSKSRSGIFRVNTEAKYPY